MYVQDCNRGRKHDLQTSTVLLLLNQHASMQVAIASARPASHPAISKHQSSIFFFHAAAMTNPQHQCHGVLAQAICDADPAAQISPELVHHLATRLEPLFNQRVAVFGRESKAQELVPQLVACPGCGGRLAECRSYRRRSVGFGPETTHSTEMSAILLSRLWCAAVVQLYRAEWVPSFCRRAT